MAKKGNTVMAGCLDVRISLYFILVLNLVLGGFYYAFAGLEAMKFTALAACIAAVHIIVNLCGFPFGEAALCARSVSRNDYRSLIWVRKASAVLIFSLSALTAIVLIAAGRPFSGLIFGMSAPAQDIKYGYIVLILMGVYILINSGVYWLRGFYQGIGETNIDARSQLLGCWSFYISSFILMVILVYGFHLNRVCAVFAVCGGMIVSSLLTLAYYLLFDKLRFKKIKALARAQMIPPMNKQKVFSDLTGFTSSSLRLALSGSLAILITAFGTFAIAGMINTEYITAGTFYALNGWMIPVFTLLNILFADSIFNAFGSKLAARRLETEKKRALIEKMIVHYLAYALCFSFILGCLSPQLTGLFYGGVSYDMNLIMRLQAPEAMLMGLSVLIARMMIVLGLGKNAVSYSMISLAFGIGLFILMPMRFGLAGILISGITAFAIFLFLCFSKISNRYEARFLKIFVMVFRILLACMAMNGVYVLIGLTGFSGTGSDMLINLALIAGMIAAGLIVYVFILHISGIDLIKRKPKKKKKKKAKKTKKKAEETAKPAETGNDDQTG